MDEKVRLLEWDACLNARDMGGYPAARGQHVPWKALVRMDNSTGLTPVGEQALLDYGIRTVIDLRFAAELEQWPSPLAQLPPDVLTYLNIPLEMDLDLDRVLMDNPFKAMSELYIRMLEANRGHVARVLTAIATARSGGVLFHCHAGKDRTGLIAASILGLLGTPDEIICADYAVCDARLEARRESVWSDPAMGAEEREYLKVLVMAPPEAMQGTLQYVREHYGSMEGYLRTTALQSETVQAMRERLLED